MNSILGQNKMGNRHKIAYLQDSVYNDVIKLSKEQEEQADVVYDNVVRSSIKILKLIDLVFFEEDQTPANLLDRLCSVTDKDELQTIFEHLFLLNTINKIASNTIQPKELILECQEQFVYFSKKYNLFRKTKLPKTWEEADSLQQIRETPELDLQEIKLIKESLLYQRLKYNPNKFYFDWYNEAVKHHQNNKNYTLVFKGNKTKLVQKDLSKQRNNNNKAKPLWKQLKEQKELFHLQTRFTTQLMQDLETSHH